MKRNTNVKRWVVYGIFLLITLSTIVIMMEMLSHKSPHGVNQATCFYEQPEHSIEVLFMGTSHIHCDVNTALLWEKYGIPGYDYSGAEQPLWMTYHYLIEAYKTQTPKVVVLDLYAPACFKDDYQYDWIDENIYGMKFSFNKLQMLDVATERERLLDYFPSFLNSHYRYKELDSEDVNEAFWLGKNKIDYKGYTPYWRRKPQPKPDFDVTGLEDTSSLTEKSRKYLKKIISLTRKKGSQLVFIVAPYVETLEERLTYQEIEKIAEEENIPMVNYNDEYERIGLDFEQDFNDNSHLNYWGGCKFTDYLAQLLMQYPVQVDRDASKYESWDWHVQDVREELREYGEEPSR